MESKGVNSTSSSVVEPVGHNFRDYSNDIITPSGSQHEINHSKIKSQRPLESCDVTTSSMQKEGSRNYSSLAVDGFETYKNCFYQDTQHEQGDAQSNKTITERKDENETALRQDSFRQPNNMCSTNRYTSSSGSDVEPSRTTTKVRRHIPHQISSDSSDDSVYETTDKSRDKCGVDRQVSSSCLVDGDEEKCNSTSGSSTGGRSSHRISADHQSQRYNICDIRSSNLSSGLDAGACFTKQLQQLKVGLRCRHPSGSSNDVSSVSEESDTSEQHVRDKKVSTKTLLNAYHGDKCSSIDTESLSSARNLQVKHILARPDLAFKKEEEKITQKPNSQADTSSSTTTSPHESDNMESDCDSSNYCTGLSDSDESSPAKKIQKSIKTSDVHEHAISNSEKAKSIKPNEGYQTVYGRNILNRGETLRLCAKPYKRYEFSINLSKREWRKCIKKDNDGKCWKMTTRWTDILLTQFQRNDCEHHTIKFKSAGSIRTTNKK